MKEEKSGKKPWQVPRWAQKMFDGPWQTHAFAYQEGLNGVDHPGYLVEALQRKGKRVTVASTVKTKPPMIADELRRQADFFLELSQLADDVGRDPAERSEKDNYSEDDFDDDYEYEDL